MYFSFYYYYYCCWSFGTLDKRTRKKKNKKNLCTFEMPLCWFGWTIKFACLREWFDELCNPNRIKWFESSESKDRSIGRWEKIYARSQHTYPWIPWFGNGNSISIVLITKKLAMGTTIHWIERNPEKNRSARIRVYAKTRTKPTRALRVDVWRAWRNRILFKRSNTYLHVLAARGKKQEKMKKNTMVLLRVRVQCTLEGP